MVVVSLFNGDPFLHLILESSRRENETSYMKITTVTSFEIIILIHSSLVFNDQLLMKKRIVLQNYRAGTLISTCMQRFLEAWKELFSNSLFTDFSVATTS